MNNRTEAAQFIAAWALLPSERLIDLVEDKALLQRTYEKAVNRCRKEGSEKLIRKLGASLRVIQKINNAGITLCRADAKLALQLLDQLSEQLESAIEAEIVPGTGDAMRGRRTLLANLRKTWRRTEDLKILIDFKLGGKTDE